MKIRNLIQKEFKIANQPPPKDKADYKAKMSTIQDLQKNPKLRDPESQANIMKRKAELATWAKKNLKKENSTEAAGDIGNEIAKMYDTAYEYINDSSDNPSDIESDYKFGYNDDDSMEAEDLAAAFRKDLKTGMALQKQLQAQREKEGREGDWDPFNPASMYHNELKALMSKAKGESVPEDADVDAQFKSDVLQFLNSKVVQIEKQIELAPANTPEEKENKEFALKLFNFVQAKLEQKDNGDNTITVPKSFKKD